MDVGDGALRCTLAADPVRIELSLSLTGPTAPAGKQVLADLERIFPAI